MSSSHFIDFLSACIAQAHWSILPGSTQTCSVALRPERVTNVSSSLSSFAATIAKR